MKIEKFEDVIAWQKAKTLSLMIYRLFKSNRDFSYCDQIQRASVSVMNNIAEGFERRSDKELMNFLYIAKGSCGEVRSMLYLAKELGYIKEVEFMELSSLSSEISKIISGFILTSEERVNMSSCSQRPSRSQTIGLIPQGSAPPVGRAG
ncbi:MAG: four helix bundle protein [bacterium]|nr:four helix bundle protein [bacterium]